MYPVLLFVCCLVEKRNPYLCWVHPSGRGGCLRGGGQALDQLHWRTVGEEVNLGSLHNMFKRQKTKKNMTKKATLQSTPGAEEVGGVLEGQTLKEDEL